MYRHRWTGRYEAHLWDKECWNDTQKKKGRQGFIFIPDLYILIEYDLILVCFLNDNDQYWVASISEWNH